MYLFTRTGTLGGDPNGAMAWAIKVGGAASAASGRQINTWVAQFGFPVGTVVWSAWLDGHADLTSAFGPLATHADYQAAANEGVAFQTTPHESALRQVVSGGPVEGAEGPGLGSVATVTTAVALGGKMAAVIAWGVEVAAIASSVSGLPVSFLVDSYGTFGQVTWIGGAVDMAAADAANDAMNASADYMKAVDGGTDLFVPASGHRALYTRIG